MWASMRSMRAPIKQVVGGRLGLGILGFHRLEGRQSVEHLIDLGIGFGQSSAQALDLGVARGKLCAQRLVVRAYRLYVEGELADAAREMIEVFKHGRHRIR